MDNKKNFKQKAPGPSGTTKKHLENLSDNALDFLKNIFNMSFSFGYFPLHCKKEHTIMNPKEGHTTDPSKYRPITFVKSLWKIFKKILKNRMYCITI